ncbi:MAG: BMP family lipoprotein [Eisenbergiella sp.]
MSKDAPKAVLTSTVWNWGAYYTSAVQSLVDGTWTGENYFGGLKEGLGTWLHYPIFAEGTAEKIEEAKAKIVSGEWDVFDGVIECNDGTTVAQRASICLTRILQETFTGISRTLLRNNVIRMR